MLKTPDRDQWEVDTSSWNSKTIFFVWLFYELVSALYWSRFGVSDSACANELATTCYSMSPVHKKIQIGCLLTKTQVSSSDLDKILSNNVNFST